MMLLVHGRDGEVELSDLMSPVQQFIKENQLINILDKDKIFQKLGAFELAVFINL